MPGLDTLPGRHVVAMPGSLDRATWEGTAVRVLRFAPDEALGLGATSVRTDDPEAIAVEERGFAGGHLTAGELAVVLEHVEWPLPVARPALAQGKIAGVPARLWLEPDGSAILVVQTAYAHDLLTRLGWLE
ncbi:MAG: hypothetical protein ACJ761_09760 [Chloroflexota bacterium]